MKEKLKIIAYTGGDSRKTSTWSNFPYFFLKTLEDKGHEVIRVNIALEDSNRLAWLFIKSYNKIYRKIFKNGLFTVGRWPVCRKLVRKKMKKALDKHPDADLLVSFDFSSSIADMTDVKTLLFCDWSIEYLIRYIRKREPTKREQKLIADQNSVIDNADYVVSIFPNAKDFMQSRTKNKIRFYDSYVINAMAELPPAGELAEARYNGNSILFIGSMKFHDSAACLIGAVKRYNDAHKNGKPLSVNVIGMTEGQLPRENFVKCYGYLNKDNAEQNKLYSHLLTEAKFLVNTQTLLGGASSIIEVMHYGVPVIVTETPDMDRLLGKDAAFGLYCRENSEDEILSSIEKIESLSLEEYKTMSQSAEKTVEHYTWDAYIDRLLDDIGKTL